MANDSTEEAERFERNVAVADAREYISATLAGDALALRLMCAIRDGSERDIPEPAGTFETERPAFVPPIAPVPEQIPATPQRSQLLVYRLYRRRRREFAEECRAREAERKQTRPAPPQGEYTLFDLTADTCHYATREAPYFFCGAAPEAHEKPYCQEHANICYQRIAAE